MAGGAGADEIDDDLTRCGSGFISDNNFLGIFVDCFCGLFLWIVFVDCLRGWMESDDPEQDSERILRGGL